MHILHPTGLLKLSFGSNWIQKTKISIYEISRILFSNIDFNFACFANSNFSHLEIEESFGLIWVKLQNGRSHLQMSILGIWKVLVLSMGIIFAHFVYKESFGQICVKITEVKVSILVLVSQIMVFHFVQFERKKGFWHILVKFIIYSISLSFSRSNKKQFQLVDLVIGLFS